MGDARALVGEHVHVRLRALGAVARILGDVDVPVLLVEAEADEPVEGVERVQVAQAANVVVARELDVVEVEHAEGVPALAAAR